jgi:hypothetical protein
LTVCHARPSLADRWGFDRGGRGRRAPELAERALEVRSVVVVRIYRRAGEVDAVDDRGGPLPDPVERFLDIIEHRRRR